MLFKCPKCKGTDVSVEVKTWCRFDHGQRSFDDSDLDDVEAFQGGSAICHQCQHQWKHKGPR